MMAGYLSPFYSNPAGDTLESRRRSSHGREKIVMADAATVHREMFKAVENQDFGKLRALYHPEYTYMSGDGVEQKGADAGVAVAEMYTKAFQDLSFEIRNQFTPSSDVSIIEFTARGTHKEELEGIPATGRQVEVVVCNVIEVRDGKIYREREYYDALSMMQQLGVEITP
jgi:steroid delta-isomerase-like uncharacterized protein